MENLSTLIYDGGLYRFNEFEDAVVDTGGFVLRREDSAVSTVAVVAVADVDVEYVRRKATEIGGTLNRASLAGSEIAVVAPSPSGRHLPHPTCDVAEFLRRSGAQTILISLARGAGQEPILEASERRLIDECDLAVFVLGDSEYCLRRRKSPLFLGIEVPAIVIGGPSLRKLAGTYSYVGGFGRSAVRLKGKQDLENLARLRDVADQCLSARRTGLYEMLPEVSLPALKEAIEEQVPEVRRSLSPVPITIRLDGLRVKLPYLNFSGAVSDVVFHGARLGDFAEIRQSALSDHILVRLTTTRAG